MPIYEYICEKCGDQTEVIHKFSDDPITTCEKCGGKLYRPISRTSFQLKGGGWYADLYSSSKPDSKAKPTDSTKADSLTKTETKSETKTEKKVEAKTEKKTS